MSDILLHRVFWPVTALGYGRRLGVWVQGCDRRCPGCMSPDTQPRRGAPLPVERVFALLPAELDPDGLTVSGGEPFDQPAAVAELVRLFTRRYNDDILIYTGYTREELLARQDDATLWLLEHIAALADGPYLAGQDPGVGLLGSTNQRLHVFRYPERYRGFARAPRAPQCIQDGDRLQWIGLLPPEHN